MNTYKVRISGLRIEGFPDRWSSDPSFVSNDELEFDVPAWSPERAVEEVKDALVRLVEDQVKGIISRGDDEPISY